MAGALESRAFFLERCGIIGVSDDTVGRLEAKGFRTMAEWAFCCSYVPGAASEDPLLEVIDDVLGGRDAAKLPSLRRLFFEAYTMAASDMKSRVERTGEEAPRQLALAERRSRAKELQDTLKGLRLEGELEPSHALVDFCVALYEDNRLRYIEWQFCTKRDQEIIGEKKDKEWKPDSQGVIRERVSTRKASAELGSDLRLKLALQRRGLAMDIALLLRFAVHEKLVEEMARAYLEHPPEGFTRVSLEQLQRADQMAFTLMAESTRDGIRPVGDKRPLDQALEDAINSPRFRMALLPLRGRSSGSDNKSKQQASTSRSRSRKKRKSRSQRLAEKNKKLMEQVGDGQGGGQDKGKGGGKGKEGGRGSRSPRMPARLRGYIARTAEGEPICFAFNLDGCSLAEPGKKCPKGWHVKMKKKPS